ncbi:MAG TPA: ferredoxin [Stellaceae bacterium]|nr:ferredoxin [Stellaceae bacterium]
MPAFPDGTPALTVCLLGWTGGEQWPAFARSPEANDGMPDPLNRWSKRLIDYIANDLDAAAFYPFGGPPWLDFQRWALKAETVHRSPLGLLIHPTWGLWHSYRGALGLRDHLQLEPRQMASNPCDSCHERPCLSACPVTAFTPQGTYHYAACRGYLEAGEADCLTQACAARRACPIAPDHRYSGEQSSFHMRAFMGGRFG